MASWVTKTQQLIAHRGNSWDHPENTRASILSAIEIGADVVEFDVSVTSDDVAIALHGPKLQKTTTGQGKSINFTWNEVEELLSVDSEGRKTGQPIPAVKDLLCEFGSRSFWNLDVKDRRAVPLIVSMIEELSLHSRVILSGLSIGKVKELSSVYPNINMLVNLSRLDKIILGSGILRRQWIIFRFADLSQYPSVVGINVHFRYVNKKLVETIHNLGMQIWTFTVNQLEDVSSLFVLGVDSVTTNRPTMRSS